MSETRNKNSSRGNRNRPNQNKSGQQKSNANRRPRKNNNQNASSTNNSGSNNNRRRHSQSRNRRPKSLTPTRILQKYENLLEQYLVARKKYFELFGRANDKQVNKAYQNYQMSLTNLRKFEDDLKEDWQQKILQEKRDAYPEDRQFSTSHELEPKGDLVSFVGEFEDPHFLDSQRSHEWSKDSEETSGSMEEYYQYKGLPIPAKNQ